MMCSSWNGLAFSIQVLGLSIMKSKRMNWIMNLYIIVIIVNIRAWISVSRMEIILWEIITSRNSKIDIDLINQFTTTCFHVCIQTQTILYLHTPFLKTDSRSFSEIQIQIFILIRPATACISNHYSVNSWYLNLGNTIRWISSIVFGINI